MRQRLVKRNSGGESFCMQIDGRATTILVLRPANNLQNQVSGVGVQKKRIGWEAGKRESFQAFWPSGLPAFKL
jgi:hypothetical protein